MGKQLLLATILGAIILFVWGAIAFTFIPWPGTPLRTFTNEDAVEKAIVANAPEPGNYVLPHAQWTSLTKEQQDRLAEKITRGPMMFAAVRLGPMRPFPVLLIVQFLIQLVSAFIATFLLLKTCGLTYGQRVVFVILCGVLIFVAGKLDEWVWWSFSPSYLMMQFGAIVIGWILAALVIAKFAIGRPAAV